MDSFGKLIVLVVIPFLVGFYGVRYYNTTQEPPVQTVQPEPQVQTESKGVRLDSIGVQMNATQIETGRIKCVGHKAGYCEEYIILKVVKD